MMELERETSDRMRRRAKSNMPELVTDSTCEAIARQYDHLRGTQTSPARTVSGASEVIDCVRAAAAA